MAISSKRRFVQGIHLKETHKKNKSNKEALIDEDSYFEEDLAQSESRRLLATSREANKVTTKQYDASDAYEAKFQNEVAQSQQELGNVLLERTLDILQQDAREEAVYISTAIYGLTHHTLRGPESSNLPSKPTTTLHPFCQTTEYLIDFAKRLLHVYDRISQETMPLKGSMELGKEWDDDRGRVSCLFENQRKVMKDRVTACLQERHSSIKPKSAADTPREEHIWKQFAGSQIEDKKHCRKDESWANVVRRVRKDVERLTKHLQEKGRESC